ncbi:hypothetical protein N0V90_011007 [Kalmusia sp. IMI 367209]|nr:hypothetical protein N0V90_011007 [Kalmusia sp. IMI 367209]
MMFPLTKLPEELISTVASHISARGDLFNFALASRQLHRIANPHLYRHIALFLGSEFGVCERLHSLVIQLLQRADVATFVQYLHIRGKWANSWGDGKEKAIDELHPILKAGIEKLTPDRKNRSWTDNVVGWGKEEALVAVLLHIVPNLRTLDMSIPDEPGMHYRWLLREVAFEPPRLLPNLKELVLINNLGVWSVPELESFLPFLLLPKLKRAFFYFKNDWNDAWSDLGDQEYTALATDTVTSVKNQRLSHSGPTSSLEHLEIREGSGDITNPLKLIGTCEVLRTFAFDVRKGWQVTHPAFYSSLVSALSIHADTLTALYLGDDYEYLADEATRVIPLSFHELVNLKHLAIPACGFLHYSEHIHAQSLSDDRMRDRFPPSLRKLVLFFHKMDEHHTLPLLQHYLSAEPLIIPYLQELIVHCHTPESMYAWLRQPTQQRRIQLRIFRKLKTKDDMWLVTPLWRSVESADQQSTQVQIPLEYPSPSLAEMMMPVEEYDPSEEACVLSFEEDIAQSKWA